MARRRGKVVLGILGGAVGLILLLVILVPLLIPREKLRTMAEDQIRTATNGEVSLGKVSLRVFPRLKLVLGESTVSVTGDGLREAGQIPGPLVSGDIALKSLEVDLALWPLLSKQVEVGVVRLVEPRLLVVTKPLEEEPDASGAAPSGSSTAGGSASVDPGVGLALAAVEVRDGEVVWQESETDRRITVAGWDQDVTAPALMALMSRLQRMNGFDVPADAIAGPVALGLETHVESLELIGFAENPMPPLADLVLKGQLNVPKVATHYEFDVTELSMPGWDAKAKGTGSPTEFVCNELTVTGGEAVTLSGEGRLAPPPAKGPMKASLTGEVDLATILDHVQPWMPPQPADAAPLPTLTGKLAVNLALDIADPPDMADPEAWKAAWSGNGLPGTVTCSAHGEHLTVDSPQLGPTLKVATVSLTADFSSAHGPTRLELKGISHPGLKGHAVAEIIPAGDDGAVQARLTLPLVDLDALALLAQEAQASDKQASAGFSLVRAAYAADPVQPLVGELIPVDLAADLTATMDEMRFLKASYTDIELQGTLRERVIDVTRLEAKLGTGRIDGTARVNYADDPGGQAAWRAVVTEAPVGALVGPFAPGVEDVWRGDLGCNVAGSCDLADPEAIKNSLSLEGTMRGSNGIIDLRESLSGVAPFLGSRQDLLKVTYKGAEQHFRVEDGKVHITGLKVGGHETDWLGAGWISLAGQLNFNLNVRLPAGFTPDLGDASFVADALRDEEGRISLDLILTGETVKPAVKLDLDPTDLLKSEAVQKGLEEEVKKGLGGLLDRLKGK